MKYIKLKPRFIDRILFLFVGIIKESYLINTTDTNQFKMEKIKSNNSNASESLKFPTKPLFFNESDVKIKSNL
jgi:hypothetical protein